MSYISLENIFKAKDASQFKIVLAAAARANDLIQGAQPLIRPTSKKISIIALEEISVGKVRYEEIKSKGKKASA